MLFSKTGFHYNVLYPKQALSKYHCCNFSSTQKNKRILSIIKSGRKTLCLQNWVNPSAHQPMGTYDIHSFKCGKWPNCSKLCEIDFWVHTFFYRLLKRFALATFTHMNTHHHSHTHLQTEQPSVSCPGTRPHAARPGDQTTDRPSDSTLQPSVTSDMN